MTSEGSEEVRVDGSSSSHSCSESSGSRDDDGEDDNGHDELGNPRPIEYVELGLQGGGAEEKWEI